MHLFLIGQPRVGKSTLGKKAASLLNIQFIDTDDLISEEYKGLSPYTITQTFGNDFFRKKEQQHLFSLKEKKDTLVATGGGIVLNPQNCNFLKEFGVCVFITLSRKDLLLRLAQKPLCYTLPQGLNSFLDDREPLYQNLADGILSSENEQDALRKLSFFWENRNEKSFWKSFSDHNIW